MAARFVNNIIKVLLEETGYTSIRCRKRYILRSGFGAKYKPIKAPEVAQTCSVVMIGRLSKSHRAKIVDCTTYARYSPVLVQKLMYIYLIK